MKQLHLTGKIACALLLTAAAITGCKDKDPVTPPSPVVDTPAVSPSATTPTPTPDAGASGTTGGTTTPGGTAPAQDGATTSPTTTPATEPAR